MHVHTGTYDPYDLCLLQQCHWLGQDYTHPPNFPSYLIEHFWQMLQQPSSCLVLAKERGQRLSHVANQQ
jgi:hypothetical protein